MRRLIGAGSHEDGFSLVEMVVAIFIFGVVGLMITIFFTSGLRTSSKADARNNDVNAGRNAITRLTRDIQAAVPDPTSSSPVKGPFVIAARNKISFYAKLDGLVNPTLVTWAVTNPGTYNGTLTRTAVVPYVNGTSVTWPTTGPTSKVVTQNVLFGVNDRNDGKIPVIFRYLDSGDAGLTALCADIKPTPTNCNSPTPYATPLVGDPLASSTPTPTAVATPVVDQAMSVEVYLQIASARDGASAAAAPYYEQTRAGSPTVFRARIYPISNTITK